MYMGISIEDEETIHAQEVNVNMLVHATLSHWCNEVL